MLKIEEVDVHGKRKAVALSTDDIAEIDEVSLLETIWAALGEYEIKRRRILGERVQWTTARVNGRLSKIVLVYPCLFSNENWGTRRKRNSPKRKHKKSVPQI